MPASDYYSSAPHFVSNRFKNKIPPEIYFECKRILRKQMLISIELTPQQYFFVKINERKCKIRLKITHSWFIYTGSEKLSVFFLLPYIISHRLCLQKTHFLPSKRSVKSQKNRIHKTKAKVQCLLLCFSSSSLAMSRFNDFVRNKNTATTTAITHSDYMI